jgi:hypothetical protein
MRFLMKTRPRSAFIDALRQNLLWIRSGCAAVFVSLQSLAATIRGLLTRHTYTTQPCALGESPLGVTSLSLAC